MKKSSILLSAIVIMSFVFAMAFICSCVNNTTKSISDEKTTKQRYEEAKDLKGIAFIEIGKSKDDIFRLIKNYNIEWQKNYKINKFGEIKLKQEWFGEFKEQTLLKDWFNPSYIIKDNKRGIGSYYAYGIKNNAGVECYHLYVYITEAFTPSIILRFYKDSVLYRIDIPYETTAIKELFKEKYGSGKYVEFSGFGKYQYVWENENIYAEYCNISESKMFIETKDSTILKGIEKNDAEQKQIENQRIKEERSNTINLI